MVVPITSNSGHACGDIRIVAADHDRQTCVAGANVAAGHGASTAPTPLAAAAAWISAASDGSLVVMSTTTLPDGAAATAPSGAEEHLADVGGEPDDRTRHVADGGDRGRCVRPLRTSRLEVRSPCIGFGCTP